MTAALPRPAPIREYSGVDRQRFDAEIRASGQPAVLRGAARDWPAVEAATQGPEAIVAYLKRFSGPQPVLALVGEPEIRGHLFYTPDLTALNFTRGQSPLDPFLDRLLRDREAARPYAIAIQSAPIPELLPGFVEENASDLVDGAVVPRMWLGNAIRVATHYDLMENVGVVVAGRRRFTLFPPDQLANLYMGPLELTPAGTPISLVDPTAPDLERYPRFRHAMEAAQNAELAPGDAIYIPFHWWHAVDSLGSLNIFVNYWWNAAKSPGRPYDALLHAIFALRGLPADQRRVWQRMFDHLVFDGSAESLAHIPAQARGVLGEIDETLQERIRATLIERLANFDRATSLEP